jgi:hypothetical protein
MLLKEIRRVESEPISFDEIQKFIPHLKANMVIVDELPETVSPELFGNLCFVMFTLHKAGQSNIRHWTLLWKDPSGYMFFDPLGNDWKTLFKKTHEPHRGFYEFLKKHRVNSSKFKLQKNAGNVATCGYHCALRALYKTMTHQAYQKFIKVGSLSTDETVAFLFFILHKFVVRESAQK